jgi:PilZ domain
MSKKDNRQHHRLPYFGPARISWDDEQGITRFAHAKCINVSEGGLRIEVGEPIPLRSQISLRADRINLSASATVRNIAWRGCKYILGLNLSQTQPAEALAIIRAA